MKIIIYAMCRSGNHAVIFWLIENMGGFTKSIYNTSYWNPEKKIYFYNNCNHVCHNFTKDYNIMIKSYEDAYDCYKKECNLKIIILRDFLNMISSRYRKYGNQFGLNGSYLQNLKEIINMWKTQANAIRENRVVGILYNKWLHDKIYRDNISHKIGFENIDKTDYVSTIGEGSSFNGIKLEQNRDNYLNRFKCVKLPEYAKKLIFDDKELIELNISLFSIDIIEWLKS